MIENKIQFKKISLAGTSRIIDESRFKINYREVLNNSQYEAVSSIDGAYLLIAGAGTGKTRTLVYRVARLIEMGFDPNSILLLTFTRKAANEMLKRASLLLDDRCSKIRGGTFHSFANLILRKYHKAVGLDSNFTILDQGDSEDVINLIRSKSKFISNEKRFPNKQTLAKVYSLSVNTRKTIPEIIELDYPHFLTYLDEILKVFKIYNDYKKRNNLLDYDDLLIYLRDFLFSESAAARSLTSEIRFLMVDEYQDTNYIQAEIVKGLASYHKNVMVVGDDSQSIYSFRGADFYNIIEFPKLFENVKIIKLEENYRSYQSILDLANRINKSALFKFEKNLYSKRGSGNLPQIIATVTENLQSKFIVEKILELREEGVKLQDIAVLFRSSFHSFDLELELSKANIPFQKFGGMKFIESAHIKDVVAFLRIIENPKDVISWYRILLLHEGIGPKTAQRILDDIAAGKLNSKQEPQEKIKSKYEKVAPLFYLIYEISKPKYLPSEILKKVLYYYDELFKANYDDWNKRQKDLDIFQNIVENYKDIETLLSDLAIEPIIESVVDIEPESKENEFVTLSTIHSAKGLEWHTVFIIHAVEGYFPSSRNAEKIEQIEEERRLMYVAVTRAKNNLFILYPMNLFDREAGRTFSKPSRFLSELTSDIAEGFLLESDF
ncbi:MAG: ATP-dependent helicase [Ignavibacterium sp.]|nr:ATP-dependent helicase [Ignavibacterium sp.]MDW8374313.1 ATP-dependent helicase [Ignavibacteriales bacterium]